MLAFLLSNHVWGTFKIQVNFRLGVLIILSYKLLKFLQYEFMLYEFKEFSADIPAELICLGDLDSLRSSSGSGVNLEVLMILTHRF